MLISIIIPVYNVEKYLQKCLDSVLNQTYKNIEVILVDDGSTDRSGQLCDRYAADYNKIRVVHKQNAGLGMARNTGLEHISGEYVIFVDSDDYLEPSFVEKMVKIVMYNCVDMCKGGFKRVYDNGKVKSERIYKNEVFQGDAAKLELLPRMIGSSPSRHDSVEMCVCGAIYKAAPIKEHCLRFVSEREMISEDMVFNIDYMQYANGACLSSDCGYNYRINTGSLTKSYREDRFFAILHFYKEVKNKLISLGYSQDTLLRLDRIFFVYLRVCIAQEKKKVSSHSASEAAAMIREICFDPMVQNIIRHYPIKCLGIRQRVFIELVRNRVVIVLYVLGQIGLL